MTKRDKIIEAMAVAACRAVNPKLSEERLIDRVKHDYIKIAKAAAEAYEANAWLPIEEYKGSEDILVTGGVSQSICSGSSDWFSSNGVHIARKYKGDDYFTVNDYFNIKPTHFQYINPPKVKQKCKCEFTQKILGDGCDICNPEYVKEMEERLG